MIELEVTLSEWLYNSVIGEEILSIDHDYFRLRKPIPWLSPAISWEMQ
jgi:hypothetical protein